MVVVTALSVPAFNILTSVLLLILVKPLAAIVSAALTTALFNHALYRAKAARLTNSLLSPFLDGFNFVAHPRTHSYDRARSPSTLAARFVPSPLFLLQFLVLAYVFTFGTLCELLFENGTGTVERPITALAFRRFLASSPTIPPVDDVRAHLFGLKVATKKCVDEAGPFIGVQRAWQYNLTHPDFVVSRDRLNCSADVIHVAVCAAGQLTSGERCNVSAPVAQAQTTAGSTSDPGEDISSFGPIHVCPTQLRGDLIQGTSFRAATTIRFLAANRTHPVLELRTDVAAVRGPCPSLSGAELASPSALALAQSPTRGLCSAVEAHERFGASAQAIEVCAWMYPEGVLLTGVFDVRNASVADGADSAAAWTPDMPRIPLRNARLPDALAGVTVVQVDTTGRWVWLPGAQSKADGDVLTALLIMQPALRDSLYPLWAGRGKDGETSRQDERLRVPPRLTRTPKAREGMWFLFGFPLLMATTALAIGSAFQPWAGAGGAARATVEVGTWTAATFDIRLAMPAFLCVATSCVVLVCVHVWRRRRGKKAFTDISVAGLLALWLKSEQKSDTNGVYCDEVDHAELCGSEAMKLRPVQVSSRSSRRTEVFLTLMDDGECEDSLKQ